MPSPSSSTEFQKKIDQEAASTLFQLVWSGVKSAGKHLWTLSEFKSAIQSYAVRYRDRFGDVKVLGMAQPIPLHEIYTVVRVVSPDFLRAFRDDETLEKYLKKVGRNQLLVAPEEHKDGIDVANRERFLNILGAPGSGKSTYLRRLGQQAMLARSDSEAGEGPTTEYRHAKIPVLIELRRFRQDQIDILAAITKEFVTCGFPDAPEFVTAALKQGKLLVLLDGLDEVPKDRLDEMILAVKDFLDVYGSADSDGDGNRFVMSCRTAHYKNFVPRFSDVVLADFSDEQIARFAQNWFSSLSDRQEQTAQRFMEQLHNPQHQQALDLARTPLLLTFLCMTYQDRQELPPVQATLYRTALEILLHKWAAERRVHNEPIYAELTTELEVDMLAEMAAHLFAADRFFFTRQQATDHIKRFMQEELNAPKSLNADQILGAIEVQQGLIVQRAHDVYSFSHLTIQEYLTAKELWVEGQATWAKIVDDHLFEERWAVVFVLLAGMGKSDELLLKMAERCHECWCDIVSKSRFFASVDSWFQSRFLPVEVNDAGPCRQAAVRCVVLAVVLDVCDFSKEMFHPESVGDIFRDSRFISAMIGDICDELAIEFEPRFETALKRPRIGDTNGVQDRLRCIVKSDRLCAEERDSIQRWLSNEENSFRDVCQLFPFPSFEVTDENIAQCRDMLVAWRLVFRCKNSAYRTTAKSWNAICNYMLGTALAGEGPGGLASPV